MAAFKESAAPPSTSAQEFYTWTFPGAPIRIHLHLNVVESLGREVRRAFESVPSHSVEIGGILYGTADFAASRIIEIKDFEPFLCEYRPDHKFILSEADRGKLEKVLAARRADGPEALSVVGYYRSHLGEGLGLRQEDVAMAQAHFYDPANVFLLVKPSADGSGSAGFFFWDNGRIDSEFTYLEFPFDARQLTGARVKPTPRPSPETFPAADPSAEAPFPAEWPAPEIPRAPLPAPFDRAEAAERRHARGGSTWWRAVFAVFMIALGALGYQAYLWWAPHGSGGPASVASDAPALALQVERKGADLCVSWNRNSQAVAQATDAVLSIRDGESQQVLHLDPDQLRNGSVTYAPANGTVRFRLEVTTPGDTKSSETVLALTAARPDVPEASKPATGPSPQSDAAAPTSPGSARDFGEPLRVKMVDPPARQPATGVPAAPQPKVSPPETSSAEGLYLPPRPVRQVQPVLPQAVRRLIATQVEVAVKVWISKTGRVLRAEPLPTGQLVSSTLVAAAQSAAMRWRFASAVRGTETVPSELILKFQYRPTR